jgi:MOSC domain-containing protein YiiM
MAHASTRDLEAGLPHVLAAPRATGTLDLIVRRPGIDERQVLEVGELSLSEGLVGDDWNRRPSSRSADGGPHPDMQLNVMAARVASLVAGDDARRPLAGDQLYVDLDLSEENIAPGDRLHIGESAQIEVTPEPHTGCDKFTQRFGLDAHRFVNSEQGRRLRLRGLNARVVTAGTIRRGDTVTLRRARD